MLYSKNSIVITAMSLFLHSKEYIRLYDFATVNCRPYFLNK